ncbi:hypothetical protein C8A03DRAFT_16711 [Achaetomium macrosporum]|uniref:Uncharacterized protein n=1 Tax=Achaetomium macrosporum TaxID=79813 RepID=A0AAN7C763_9PEZI|nr:hypothetical protein C8A03DRAFT_16711 [Achaetomium macrosporum]
MCFRKFIIHHRCGHHITTLVEDCENIDCRSLKDKPVISNRYPCVVLGCPLYGRFN